MAAGSNRIDPHAIAALGQLVRDMEMIKREKRIAAAAAAASGGYATKVGAIGNIVSYWRMGAASGNQPDTSANPLGAKDLIKQTGSATASTYKVTGADAMVATNDDDGAWQSNRNQAVVDDGLGAGDYFSASDASNQRWSFTNVAAFTVSFFFKQRSGWTLPSGLLPIMGTDPGDHVVTTYEGWSILVQNLTNGPQIIVGRGGTSSSQLVGPQVAVDKWTHICHTYDGTTMRLYFNGSLVTTLASTIGNSGRNDIRVGGGRYNAADRGEIYGALDEIAIFSRALTAAEVLTLANNSTNPSVYGIANVSAAYSITNSDQIVFANGTFTVTLPTAVGIAGRFFTVKNTGAGTITVGRTGTETIDGTAANVTISTAKQARTFVSDGTGWQIINGYL